MAADLTKVGRKIRQMWEKANLIQKQLADFLSVDQSLISKFEKGERSVQSDVLEKLAALFCCPISVLVSDEMDVPSYAIAFRITAIENADLDALSVINKIALNQFKMDWLALQCRQIWI